MIRTASAALILALGIAHGTSGLLASTIAQEKAERAANARFSAVYTDCLHRASMADLESDRTDSTGCDRLATAASRAVRP